MVVINLNDHKYQLIPKRIEDTRCFGCNYENCGSHRNCNCECHRLINGWAIVKGDRIIMQHKDKNLLENVFDRKCLEDKKRNE